jgi:hypothetical protein
MYSHQINRRVGIVILEPEFYILANKIYCLIRFNHVKIKNIAYF